MAVISRLSRARPTSTLFTPCWSMVQLLLRTILMPVRSQFRINSRGDFFHFHSGYHVFQNSLFTQSKSVMAYLIALCCGRLSLDKVHPMQQCVCPVSVELNMPSELHQHGSVTGQDNPPTATIAICADIYDSSSFFKYNCTFRS